MVVFLVGKSPKITTWAFSKLEDPFYSNLVQWIDRDKGLWKIVSSAGFSKLWGEHKNRPNMMNEHLSRALRLVEYYNFHDSSIFH